MSACYLCGRPTTYCVPVGAVQQPAHPECVEVLAPLAHLTEEMQHAISLIALDLGDPWDEETHRPFAELGLVGRRVDARRALADHSGYVHPTPAGKRAAAILLHRARPKSDRRRRSSKRLDQ